MKKSFIYSTSVIFLACSLIATGAFSYYYNNGFPVIFNTIAICMLLAIVFSKTLQNMIDSVAQSVKIVFNIMDSEE